MTTSHFVYRLIPPRPSFAADMNDTEQAIMGEHAVYWNDLFEQGNVAVYGQRSPDWPGKEPAWRSELLRYDQFLLVAASVLDVVVPAHDGDRLTPEVGAIIEDRLSQAGLDVWAPRVIRSGGCY